VATDFFTPASRRRHHALAVARLVPHKRIQLAVEAFRDLDQELVVVGGGPLLEPLRARAPANVRLIGYVDDERLRELYRSSTVLVCPSIEEFGIAMAEAQAAGTPVIAPRAGGAAEIVGDGTTGILLERVDPGSISDAVRAVASRGFKPNACRVSAERFGERRFLDALHAVLSEERPAAGPASGRALLRAQTARGAA
jgi:glycosyltransferase involved in cell wall biosynthesis